MRGGGRTELLPMRSWDGGWATLLVGKSVRSWAGALAVAGPLSRSFMGLGGCSLKVRGVMPSRERPWACCKSPAGCLLDCCLPGCALAAAGFCRGWPAEAGPGCWGMLPVPDMPLAGSGDSAGCRAPCEEEAPELGLDVAAP